MCTYVKKISAWHYIALTAKFLSKFVQVVEKRHGMNKFVCTKSHTGSKFSEIILEQLYAGWTVVVHLYYDFSLWRQMAPQQQSAKFRTAVFGQFRSSLRKDHVANYPWIWTLFSTSVAGPDVLCNALNISQIRLKMAPQDSQICGRNFAKCKQ